MFLVIYCLWCWEIDQRDMSSYCSCHYNFCWAFCEISHVIQLDPLMSLCFYWMKWVAVLPEVDTSWCFLITGESLFSGWWMLWPNIPRLRWCFSTADWRLFLANVDAWGLWNEPLLSLGRVIFTSHGTVMQDDSKSVKAGCKMSYINE